MTRPTIHLGSRGFVITLPTPKGHPHELNVEMSLPGLRALKEVLVRYEQGEKQLATRGNPLQPDLDKLVAEFKRATPPAKPFLKLSDGSELDLSNIEL